MTSWIKSITVDCEDALPVAAFWAAALGGELDEDSTSDKAYVEAPGWGGVNLWFQRVPEPKTAKNRLHLDLRAPGSGPDAVAERGGPPRRPGRDRAGRARGAHRDARPGRQRVLRRAVSAPKRRRRPRGSPSVVAVRRAASPAGSPPGELEKGDRLGRGQRSFSSFRRETRSSSSPTRTRVGCSPTGGGRRSAGRCGRCRAAPWPCSDAFRNTGDGPTRGPSSRVTPRAASGQSRRAPNACRSKPVSTRTRRRTRGGGWQTGQKYDERFMKATRRMGVPQRSQGRPSWP